MALGRDSAIIVPVFWDTELSDLLEFYLADGLEMADHSVVTLRGKECTVPVKIFWDRAP